MPKKNDGLTPRQRQSQQIMREKAARKKREERLHKGLMIGAVVLPVLLLGSGIWLWKSGTAVRLAEHAVDGAYGLTAKAGFSVQSLYLEGRNRTAMFDIDKALGVKKGDPILQLSLCELRDRLEKIDSVKSAAVERVLPHTLTVRIVEREPVALWQHQGKTALVDDQGNVMNDIPIAPYKQLPLIIGDDAPHHVEEILALLAAEPTLAPRFQAAMRVGERRWNIRVSAGQGGNVDIKLPENDPQEAWKTLAELQAKQRVLDRDIKMIDLRVQGRLFMKLPPAPQDKVKGAKET